MDEPKYDFVGMATAYNVPCEDSNNRVIASGAFKGQNNTKVTMVWSHTGKEMKDIVGHGYLSHTPEGMKIKGKFNSTKSGRKARALVHDGDIDSLSIRAYKLVKDGTTVLDGVIKEVSLVMSGANPGAKILEVVHQNFDHLNSDDDFVNECIIHSGYKIELIRDEQEKDPVMELTHEGDETIADILKTLTPLQASLFAFMVDAAAKGGPPKNETKMSANSGDTVKEVFDSLNEKQKNVLYYMIGTIKEDSLQQSLDDELEEDGLTMRSIFENNGTTNNSKLQHERKRLANEFLIKAKQAGSTLRNYAASVSSALEHSSNPNDELLHSVTNIDYLFPESPVITNPDGSPFVYGRDMEWVSKVLGGVKDTPFLKIKTVYVDLNPDAARAKGYVTGNEKTEEVIELLRRETEPQTIYKYQKMANDDVIDLDFDSASWIRSEMQMMWDEEIARAILVTDGRPAGDEKIKVDKVRPIWGDAHLYSHLITEGASDDLIHFIDAVTLSMEAYKGSGSPSLFISPGLLGQLLTIRDPYNHRLYETSSALAAAMGVSEIVSVPVMTGLSRVDTTTRNLLAIMVNLKDYRTATKEKGKKTFRTGFEIKFNTHEFLLEGRFAGALVKPKSAIVFERNTGVTP